MINKDKEISLENVLINEFFLLQFAASKVLTKAEKLAHNRNVGLKHDLKYNHNLIMDCTKRLQVLQERQLELANILNIDNYDALLKDNLYCVRLILRIWDRAYGDETVLEKVEEYIKSLPSRGLVEDSQIEELFKFKG